MYLTHPGMQSRAENVSRSHLAPPHHTTSHSAEPRVHTPAFPSGSVTHRLALAPTVTPSDKHVQLTSPFLNTTPAHPDDAAPFRGRCASKTLSAGPPLSCTRRIPKQVTADPCMVQPIPRQGRGRDPSGSKPVTPPPASTPWDSRLGGFGRSPVSRTPPPGWSAGPDRQPCRVTLRSCPSTLLPVARACIAYPMLTSGCSRLPHPAELRTMPAPALNSAVLPLPWACRRSSA